MREIHLFLLFCFLCVCVCVNSVCIGVFGICRWRAACSVGVEQEHIVYRRLPPPRVVVLRISETRLLYSIGDDL